MGYFEVLALVAGVAALGYFKRHGFRRAWYVLRTGAENPDWEKLGAEYFLGKKRKE
jgi:hypothetical protein